MESRSPGDLQEVQDGTTGGPGGEKARKPEEHESKDRHRRGGEAERRRGGEGAMGGAIIQYWNNMVLREYSTIDWYCTVYVSGTVCNSGRIRGTTVCCTSPFQPIRSRLKVSERQGPEQGPEQNKKGKLAARDNKHRSRPFEKGRGNSAERATIIGHLHSGIDLQDELWIGQWGESHSQAEPPEFSSEGD